MDFSLTEEQEMIRSLARDFAEREIMPIVRDNERNKVFPRDIIMKMAPLGLVGGLMPPEYGGAGLDYTSHALIAEELGRVSWSICITIPIVQIALIELTILNWGNEAQRRKYLPPLVKGEIVGCFCAVEPNVGSDAASIETSAALKKNQWVLNGIKTWVTNGNVADIAIVFAQTDKSKGHRGIGAFLVERGTLGFSSREIKQRLGLHSASEAEIIVEDCCIPEDNLIGEVGQGFAIAMSGINNARYTIAAGCVGLAQSCINASIKYAQERHQFGRPIGSFQLIQGMIADMIVETEAARLLVYRTGYLKDKGLPNIRETSIAKYYATEAALRAANSAIRIHGGYGYSDEFPVERYLRDAMGPILFGGTSEVQKLIIGRDALGISAFV